MSDDRAENPFVAQSKAFQAKADKSSDDIRGVAKWVVGGVVAAAGSVIAGASLTSLGGLGWGWRLELAFGAATAGLVPLGVLMWVALGVLAPRSYSLKHIEDGRDISLRRWNTIKPKVLGALPKGIDSIEALLAEKKRLSLEVKKARVEAAQPGHWLLHRGDTIEAEYDLETLIAREEIVRASAIYEHLVLLFRELKIRIFVLTPFIAIALWTFAWAANPPKDSGPPAPIVVQGSSKPIQIQIVPGERRP